MKQPFNLKLFEAICCFSDISERRDSSRIHFKLRIFEAAASAGMAAHAGSGSRSSHFSSRGGVSHAGVTEVARGARSIRRSQKNSVQNLRLGGRGSAKASRYKRDGWDPSGLRRRRRISDQAKPRERRMERAFPAPYARGSPHLHRVARDSLLRPSHGHRRRRFVQPQDLPERRNQIG